MTIDYAALPPLAHDPAHVAAVSTLARLRQTDVERFLARCTGSHAAAIFLREVLYWLSPSDKAPERPRSTVFRNGHYWMARTQKEWDERHYLSRSKLETVYARCEDFIEIDHFMFGRQRQTHYRLKFERLREEIARDEVVQACLQADLERAKPRTAPGDKIPKAVCGSSRIPSLHSVESVDPTIALTGCAGVCECSPSAPAGAAAPAPPPEPPADRATSDSVEAAPVQPEVTTFCKARVILKAAEGETTTNKFKLLSPYGPETYRTLGYLLVWQRRCELGNRTPGLTEAHFLQARKFALESEVSVALFSKVLCAAWATTARSGWDPLFHCTRFSKKFTLFLRHFEKMEDELMQEGLL